MTLYIICFIIVLIDVIIGAKLINNCSIDSIRYEKIIGLYPPEKYQKLLLYQQQQQQQQQEQPITLECFNKCNQLKNCQSFIIFYNISTCYYYQTTIIENYNEQKQYNYDINTVWLKKFCLNYKNNCKKLWIFERIPGAKLIQNTNNNNTKRIQQYLTRTECQQYCLNEQQFVCRSIQFKINYNYNNTNNEIKGICILINTDRFQSPNSYRISNYDDEYFENQCTIIDRNNHNFCTYDQYKNATILTHHDLLYQEQTKDNCQELCDNLTIFNCRSFSLIDKQCYLYSIDSKLLGPNIIKYASLDNHYYYYERTKCLNLTIQCNDKEMIINYQPDIDFNGILYMDGYIDKPTCSINRNNNNLLILKLSLIENNNNQYNCGLIKIRNQLMNRTLIGGRLILQYNRFIQTQNDRIIRIGCIYNYKQNNRIIIGSGITINTNSSTIHSSHLFNLTNNNNNGDNPMIEMRIIDYNTKEEVSNTEIGQELQLIIELKPKTLYDFRAYDLIAMTENGQDSIYLLDDNGCPINTLIFPKLTKKIMNNSQQLIGHFQAFKFVSSTIVRFSVIVEFCSNTCRDYDCNQQQQRYKRELFRNHTRIINVNRNEFENQFRNHGQLPLELIMIVRNSSGVIADRLVIGDRKILIAGYGKFYIDLSSSIFDHKIFLDYINNEVCFDYSLLIGLIILLILIQLIFLICTIMIVRYYKKYYDDQIGHLSLQDLDKNFDMGYTNRHVHWADNEELT